MGSYTIILKIVSCFFFFFVICAILELSEELFTFFITVNKTGVVSIDTLIKSNLVMHLVVFTELKMHCVLQ